MLKEYMQIDTDGFIVEKYIYDDEDPEAIPDDCKPAWESKKRFFVPKYNKVLFEWEEGASGEALAAEASRVGMAKKEKSKTLEERVEALEAMVAKLEALLLKV